MQHIVKEVDLKPYARTIRRKWWAILLCGLVMACLGLFWSTIRVPMYRATALIAVTQARPAIRLDDIETINNGQEPLGVIYNSLPQLALSDVIVTSLLAETDAFADAETPLTALRGSLEANPVMSPSLLGLYVTLPDREEATRLTNLWADILIAQANQLYDGYGEEQVVQYEQQLQQLDIELAVAQQALAAFQARNDATSIQNRLDATVEQQALYLVNHQALMRFEQDVEAFIFQMELADPQIQVSLNDQLTLISLQSRAYGLDSNIPFQINLTEAQDLDKISVAAQIVILNGLWQTMSQLSEKVVIEIDLLNPQITDLQGQWQLISNEADLLLRQVSVISEARTALARKVEESRIAAQTINRPIQMASVAAMPEFPVGPRKLIIVIVAGVVGVVLATIFILLLAWLRQIGYLLEQPVELKKGKIATKAAS